LFKIIVIILRNSSIELKNSGDLIGFNFSIKIFPAF